MGADEKAREEEMTEGRRCAGLEERRVRARSRGWVFAKFIFEGFVDTEK